MTHVEDLIAAMQARIDELEAAVHRLQDPRGRLFLAVVDDSDHGTFHEVIPNDTEIVALEGGRIVSNSATASITLRDPTVGTGTDAKNAVAILGFQNGTSAAYVRIAGGPDIYQVEDLVASSPTIIRISDDNNTDDILEFYTDTMDDGRPCVSLRFKDPPTGFPVLSGNSGNVVWDGVRLDNA